MIVKNITVIETGIPIGALKKEIPKASKAGFIQVGKVISERFVPKRFTIAHGKLARYRRRSEDYRRRKQKFIGHSRPFVFSGRTEVSARSTKTTVNSKGVKVTPRIRALNFRPNGWPAPMRQEFLRFVAQERREVSRVHTREMGKALTRSRRNRRRRKL